jgi:septal ring factor EnvC (AmiA/AmiB activator)
MTIHIEHVHISSPDINSTILIEKLNFLTLKLETMSEQLDKLTQEVAENKTVMASAVTLLQGLKQRLDEAGTDATKLAELSAELDSNTNALAAAVAANTPAENEEEEETDNGGTGTDTGTGTSDGNQANNPTLG